MFAADNKGWDIEDSQYLDNLISGHVSIAQQKPKLQILSHRVRTMSQPKSCRKDLNSRSSIRTSKMNLQFNFVALDEVLQRKRSNHLSQLSTSPYKPSPQVQQNSFRKINNKCHIVNLSNLLASPQVPTQRIQKQLNKQIINQNENIIYQMNNSSLPLLPKKPINLMKIDCTKIMKRINQEYVPTKTHFYSADKSHKKKQAQQFTFALSQVDLHSSHHYNEEPKIPKRARNESQYQPFKLHVDVQKTDESVIISLDKWNGPRRLSQSPPKKSSVTLPPISLNYKQRNSQSLMALRSQQLDEMKKLQRLIREILIKQDYQMNHHFDSLQQELSQ